MSFTEFVLSGYDPCVNVVLLEDAAAVAGVVIAAGCMGLSHYTASHIPDAAGQGTPTRCPKKKNVSPLSIWLFAHWKRFLGHPVCQL